MRHCMQGSSVSRLFWTAAVLVTLGVVPVWAECPDAETPTAEDQVSIEAEAGARAPGVNLAGFLAFADPQTGVVRAPNAEEAEALAIELSKRGVQLQNRSNQQIEVRTLANGMEGALLGLESVNFSFAQVQADGSVAFSCGLDHDHSVHAPAAAADTTTERRATRPEM